MPLRHKCTGSCVLCVVVEDLLFSSRYLNFYFTLKRGEDVYCIPLSSMHVIGHSLGAHVAGYAGQRLNKLGRITGLDPAEPYFQYTLEDVRLDPGDANFVDVIHTDGGSFITGGLGMIQDCGHVDFYPNGGKRQPGCNQNVVGAIEKEGDLLYGIRRFIGCNHIRAYEFFSESINSDCPFYGYVCDTYDNFSTGKCPWGCGPDESMCAPMGLKAEKWKKFARDEPVKMFLHTSNTEPFCRHHYIINLRCSYSEEGRTMHTTEKGRLFVRLTGTKAQSPVLEAKKEYVQFFPGSTVEFLVSTTQMGRLLRLDLEWRSTASLLNPLTWRLFNVPQIHIRDVIVTHLETGERVVFCGRDEALIPHKIKTIFANQSCVRPPMPFMEEKKKKQDLDVLSSRHKARFFAD
ncbi:pancreatic triacylglycerol lipase [Nephila pilipes]|uniref:Pancreatic triacylglycerol lipase n=1 Tax=Nephila pilipes TaxID=299642 RepID=A0A8X6NDC7_NEPPI|nr:pancreatic triacylglycerol lipase [Nephila pilipes]